MPQYSDIPVTPVYGPLSHQYPGIQPRLNLAVQNGPRVTPIQLYPSQEPIDSDQNTTARQQYIRTAKSALGLAVERQRQLNKVTRNNNFNYSTGVAKQTSGHMNYIAPTDSSLRTQRLKANAVGKSALKVGLSENAPITTKNYEPSNMRTHLRRVRSGGCTAPAKKGSIFNQSLRNGRTCAYGSIVRNQDYIVDFPPVSSDQLGGGDSQEDEGETYTYNVDVYKGNNVWGSGNKFYLNDQVSPHITFTAGNKYRFLQGDSTNANHPLRFSTTPNGTHAGGTSYTDGVTIKGVLGTPGAYTELIATSSTPVLYYFCATHPGMGDKPFFDANGEDLK